MPANLKRPKENNHDQAIPHILKLVIGAAAVAVAPWSIAANTSASSSGTVVTPIAISKAADLVFGKFAAVSGGTITVSTSGARSVSGAVIGMSGTPAAAWFDVTGEANATYSIKLAAPATLDSGVNTMAFAVVSDLTGALGRIGQRGLQPGDHQRQR